MKTAVFHVNESSGSEGVESGQLESDVKQSDAGEISELLAAWGTGEPGADERLFALVYDELRKLAAYHRRREGPDNLLQTTALVHKAYLRLVGYRLVNWKNRGHFCAIASQAMRRILVDYARRRKAAKRGDRIPLLPLDSVVLAMASSVDLLDLDLALEKLEQLDPQEARGVELRFFAGLTVPEVALALEVPRATLERDWAAARAWLGRELRTGDEAIG